MKTAISLPDTLYSEAEAIAKAMKIPRSQLFAKALEDFINLHNRELITQKLNAIYSRMDISDISSISNSSLESLRELTKNDAW